MYRLKIGGEDIDISNDIALRFTYSSTDASDPAAVKNTFSKTVKIPGTPRNNKVFGDIWNVSRAVSLQSTEKIHSGFNPKKKVSFELTNNGELIERGYVKLNKITSNFFYQEYELTLYGDLGDFFYALSTNDDGSKKTLADLYYGFSPVLDIGDSRATLPATDEDTGLLMKWTSDIICEGWHELSYLREPSAATKVTNFITAVPCLTGLYDDFDSKSMIVNNLIRYQGLPEECEQKWDEALPTSFTTDTATYSVYQDPLSSYKSTYSKIEYPRDLEGVEAGDLRATELPVAIKLSKVLDAIAASGNNGGYEVEYSTSLTTSNYWKYGWIMLDKPDFTLLPETAELTVSNIYVDANLTSSGSVIVYQDIHDGMGTFSVSPFDTTQMQNPELNLVFNNKVTVFETMYPGSYSVDMTHINELSNNYYWGMPRGVNPQGAGEWEALGAIWKGLVVIVDMYDGNTLVESYPILFHVDNQDHHFGEDTLNAEISVHENIWKPAILQRVNQYYGTSFSSISIHQCIHTAYRNGVIEYSEPIAEVIPLHFTSSNFRVGFRQLPVGYYHGVPNISESWEDVSQAYLPNIDPLISWSAGQDAPQRYQRCPYHYPHYMYINGTDGWRSLEYTEWLHHKTVLGFNYAFNIGVTQEQEYYKTVNATKRVLLSNSMSPYELLTGISKMMNMKYIYDKASRTIKIVTPYEYYLEKLRPVKIDDRCDFSHDLAHNFILSEAKYIDFSYDKNDAYPVYLWRKNNDKEYESCSFDTGLEFNFDTKKFFDNKFKQSSLYQINSQFLKTFEHQILPSVFGTNVFDYSLFSPGSASTIDSETIQSQTGCQNPNTRQKSDPYICLFDKSQKRLSTQMPSLIFLNGFYKNFRQVERKIADGQGDRVDYINVPKLMVSDDFYAQEYLNADRCWLWSYEIVYGDFTGWGYTFEHNAAVWAMPFFSRDLTVHTSGAAWINSKRASASWDMQYDYTDYYTENGMTLINYPTTFTLYATSSTQVAPSATTLVVDVDKSQSTMNYMYPKFWQSTMEDMYDVDGRELEVWIDLKGEDPNTFIRKFYYLLGSTWIVEKIIDVERKDIKTGPVKCKLLKISDPAGMLKMTAEQREDLAAQAQAMQEEQPEE